MTNDIKKIVLELKAGNQKHFEQLYNATFAGAEAVARRYLHESTESEDIIQEAYIISIEKISTLNKPESYPSWLNQIVATRSMNLLRRKNPVLFSEMTSDESDADIDFEDETPSFSPEKMSDIKATTEAVEKVMNLLPEMQRDVLWMHYGQDIPVKNIAEACGVSENTIKSRLKQGRDKLYGMQGEFRKYGIEVTAITVATLLCTSFTISTDAYAKQIAGSATAEAAKTAILKNTVASLPKHAAVTAGAKIGIAVAVTAVVVGVVAGVTYNNSQKSADIETSSESDISDETETEVENDTEAQNESDDKRNEQAISEYKDILNDLKSLEAFDDDTEPTGYYMYALVRMKQGEGPSLLLSQAQTDGTDCVRIYYYDEENEKMYQTKNDFIQSGVADAGGFRGSLSLESDDDGLLLKSQNAMDSTIYYTRYTRKGSSLKSADEGKMDASEDLATDNEHTIQWHSFDDLSALDDWPEISESTGDDGYPSDYGKTKVKVKKTKKVVKKDVTGLYAEKDGYLHSVTQNKDGSITVDDMGKAYYDKKSGEYIIPTVTGGFSIDTSKEPYELHIYGEDEVICKKTD